MKKPSIVEVTWHDAFLRSSPATLEDAIKDDDHAVRRTVGWLVVDNDKKVVVAMTFDPGGDGEVPEFDDRYTIPRGYVQTIKYITNRPKKEKEKANGKVQDPS